MATQMLDDKREIESVVFDDDDHSTFSTGKGGVTRIEAYGEPGEHCLLPWLAVYKGPDLIARIPAKQVVVYYKEAP